MTRYLISALVVGALAVSAQANDAKVVPSKVAAPVPERFATESTDEVPDFQRHVVPLFGKLGCSGRACHGSFQGRGGFRLSLFGYDFKFDHDALTKGGDGARPAARRYSPRAERLRALCDVAERMAQVHAQGYVHNDIKPDNVLIDGAGRHKVADFGYAETYADHATNELGLRFGAADAPEAVSYTPLTLPAKA